MSVDYKKLEEHRTQTKLNVIEMLKIHRKICVIRPCSWEKHI